MKRLITLSLALLLLCSFTISSGLPQEFKKLLKRAKMSFTPPDGYSETAPIKNKQMNWELAYKHPEKKFEVRYAIRPMDVLLKEHKEKEAHKKEMEINIHPNNWYRSVFEMTVLNISGGLLPDYNAFPSKAVKKEFNADWGATAYLPVGEEFGQGYKYCLFIFIHKDDLGDGYVFFMGDDSETILQEAKSVFHCLKFK